MRYAHGTAGMHTRGSRRTLLGIRNACERSRDSAAATHAPERAIAETDFRANSRALQITALIAEGFTNKDIAAEFKISEETVKHHLK